MSQKVKFAFYLPPEKKEELESRYHEDGSRSITAFVENAVSFYLDYLSANNAGAFLPAAIKSVIEGRLGMFEDRMASLMFKQNENVCLSSLVEEVGDLLPDRGEYEPAPERENELDQGEEM